MFNSDSAILHMLLVEDNPGDVVITREAMKSYSTPYELHVAQNGEEALRFLRREGPFNEAPRPHVVLLDLNLPRKDGREVVREMRADAKMPPIPVIVLTTSSLQEDICALHRLGANCFMTKPSTLRGFLELMQAIEQFWFHRVKLPTDC